MVKQVARSQLSNIRMVAGNEAHIDRVIVDGNVHLWIGVGWVNEGMATEGDRLKYPEVIENE